jgi:transcriptional regulator with XRE-family HTH domain
MTRLEQLRIDAGLTPESLADRAHVGSRTIRRIEAGHGARLETLVRLGEFFRVPPSDLIREALPVGSQA